jgi:glycosyltransferase involved in cell wall biosynthesis
MRVVHLSTSDREGGAARAASRIHKGMRSAGIESTMFVAKKSGDDIHTFGPGSASGKVVFEAVKRLDRLPLSLIRSPDDKPRTVGLLGAFPMEKCLKLNPDIVQLHWITGGFLTPMGLMNLREKPIVWRLADMWPFAGSEHYVGSSTRFIEGYSWKNREYGGFDVDQFVWRTKRFAYSRLENLTLVAPSNWMAESARSSSLFRNRRIEVIPTGHETEVFRPFPKDLARELFGISPRGHLLMFGATNAMEDSRKGIHFVTEAVKALAQGPRGTNFELAIFGASEPATGNPFPVKTHFLGKLQDDLSLAMAYSAADVFLAPSLEENLPNTVIESMACGTPCVVFDSGGVSDLVKDQVNGVLVGNSSPQAIANGIEWLTENPNRWGNISENARRHISDNFSITQQTRRFLELYDDILT